MAYGNKSGWSRGAWGLGAWGQPITDGGWGSAGIPSVDHKKIKALRQQQYRIKDDEEVSALIMLKLMRGTYYDY
jgi:hypothetical protein